MTPHEHHHHEHHHHEIHLEKLNTIYIVAVVLNLLFVVVEAVLGVVGHSVGLLSDAGHNLSDVFCLLLALIAVKLSQTHATRRFTYGYRKSSVLISLLNAILLLVAVGMIMVESIGKFVHPAEVNGSVVAWTAAAGVLVNGITTWMLSHQQKHDLNTRGAFLHMLADTLVSVGVLVSGIVIAHTGWTIIDPIIGLLIALIILVSTWKLLAESLRISIDAVPEHIDMEYIVSQMKKMDGVTDIHHVHIWAISTTEAALTAHVVIRDLQQMEEVTHRLKDFLEQEGIAHSTLEVETGTHHCRAHDC